MNYKNNKKIAVMLVVCSTLLASTLVYAACSFLEQFPTSNRTDPDKLRGNNRCNEDNDCQPGTYCSSFGYCAQC